jgi:hypothetical protein
MNIGGFPLALMVWLIVGGTTLSEPVIAQTAMPSPDEARSLIEAVLSGEDFGSTREQETWVYVGDGLDDERAEDDPPTWLPIDLILAIATVLKWALAIAAAAALLLLGYRLWLELRGLRIGGRKAQHGDTPSTIISDGAATLQPLPDDITAAVRALLAANDARGALSLLYRAQIAHLRASGLDIPDSATEADCLDAAMRATTPAQIAWLRRLTRLWQSVAYGHRPADPEQIGHLLVTHPAVAGPTEAA